MPPHNIPKKQQWRITHEEAPLRKKGDNGPPRVTIKVPKDMIKKDSTWLCTLKPKPKKRPDCILPPVLAREFEQNERKEAENPERIKAQSVRAQSIRSEPLFNTADSQSIRSVAQSTKSAPQTKAEVEAAKENVEEKKKVDEVYVSYHPRKDPKTGELRKDTIHAKDEEEALLLSAITLMLCKHGKL